MPVTECPWKSRFTDDTVPFLFHFRLLHVAALWDNGELLTDLLHGEERSCLDARDSLGRTALHAAATNPASRCLAILLAAGAEVDALCGVKGEGRTPLHVAAEHGHAHNARILAQAGANLLLRDQMGLTALDLAEKSHHEKCVQVGENIHNLNGLSHE